MVTLDPRISRWLSRSGKLCWTVNVPYGRRATAAKAHTARGPRSPPGLSSSRAKRAFQLDLDALVQFSAFVDRGQIGRTFAPSPELDSATVTRDIEPLPY